MDPSSDMPDPLAFTVDPWGELGDMLGQNPQPEEPQAPAPDPALLGFAAPESAPTDAPMPEAQPPGALQPGLGIPASTLEQSLESPPPPPDASSWVAPNAGFAEHPEQLPPPTWLEPQAGFQRSDRGQIDDEAARRASMPTEQRLLLEADEIAQGRELTRGRELDAMKRLNDEKESLAKAHEASAKAAQTEMEAVHAEAKKLAAEKVDPNHWWSSRSTGQKVAGFIAAIVGGLVQSRKGGPNSGLEMINQAIAEDIDAQKANIANRRAALGERRGAVSDQLAQAVSVERAMTARAVASYERVIGDLQAEQQKFDPKGTAVRELTQTIVGLRAQQYAVASAHAEKTQKATLEAAKFNLDVAKYSEDVREHKAKEAQAAAKLAGAGLAAGKGLLTPEEIQRDFNVTVAKPMTQKELNLYLEGKGKAQDLEKGANTTGLSKEQLERSVPGLELETKQPDGTTKSTPFYAIGAPEETKKLRSSVTSTKKLVRLMDEAVRLRTGWSSDTAKSGEWQKLKANWAAAVGEAKGEGQLALGVLTGPDMALVGEFLGTSDPTEFRDPTAGIMKARENLINATNDAAEGLAPPGAKLKRFDVPYIKPAAPTLDKDDEAFKAAKGEHKEAQDRRLAQWQADKAARGGVSSEMPPLNLGETAQYIDALTKVATGTDDSKKKKALERLEDIARDAITPEAKAYAQAKLNSVITAGIPYATKEQVR